MKSSALVLFCFLALFLVACKDNNQPVGPDLATSLVGKFNATYLITGPASQSNSLNGSQAFVQFERKSNNTLTINVKINDRVVQVNDQYDAVITTESLEKDGLQRPGLRNLFRLTADNLDGKGSGASTVYLYNDGQILGGIAYIDALGRIVSLAFVP